jgi:hypothetical protein
MLRVSVERWLRVVREAPARIHVRQTVLKALDPKLRKAKRGKAKRPSSESNDIMARLRVEDRALLIWRKDTPPPNVLGLSKRMSPQVQPLNSQDAVEPTQEHPAFSSMDHFNYEVSITLRFIPQADALADRHSANLAFSRISENFSISWDILMPCITASAPRCRIASDAELDRRASSVLPEQLLFCEPAPKLDGLFAVTSPATDEPMIDWGSRKLGTASSGRREVGD